MHTLLCWLVKPRAAGSSQWVGHIGHARISSFAGPNHKSGRVTDIHTLGRNFE